MTKTKPDVLVVGGGHAGVEAVAASARMGLASLLVTSNLDTVGQMSCNPAIGGIGKTHLVREVDALGGIMGAAADASAIQGRVLNRRKGPAVQAVRLQTDRAGYRRCLQELAFQQGGLGFLQAEVSGLWLEGDRARGVLLTGGGFIEAQSVVLTTGTFLAGQIHVGTKAQAGGRAGEPPAEGLAAWLRKSGFHVKRLKTGTPPRLDGRTIHWAGLTPQPGDDPLPFLSGSRPKRRFPAIPCYVTETNPAVHDRVWGGLNRSAIYSGKIDSTGPRYCPSIEDKVVRFPDRTGHTVFLEPEGSHTPEVYPNGISTSLPPDDQEALVRKIQGLEDAQITRYGYAIEYDFLDPRHLKHSLEMREVAGLFLAGQINGTTGYEEAAAQGLLAGLNAGLKSSQQEPWWPKRDEAYLGVLVDDLVTQGVDEPYRMLTSRAESRLQLRPDNAEKRLTPIGHRLGLVGGEQWSRFLLQQEAETTLREKLSSRSMEWHGNLQQRQGLSGSGSGHKKSYLEVLRQPEWDLVTIAEQTGDMDLMAYDPATRESVENGVVYEGYLQKDGRKGGVGSKEYRVPIPEDFPFASIPGLSNEMIERLEAAQPKTVGQAAGLRGMTPAGLGILAVYAKRWRGGELVEKS